MQAMPKVMRDRGAAKGARHNPLTEDILEHEATTNLRPEPRRKRRGSRPQAGEDEDEAVVPERISRKVMQVAQEQKKHEEEDEDDFPQDAPNAAQMEGGEDAGDDIVLDVEVDDDGFVVMPSQLPSEEEERALAMFMPGAAAPKAGPTLADIILQKIKEQESRADKEQAAVQDASSLSPKVIQVYGDIGKWLKHYKQGVLPKAFKVIPSLTNWEEVLSLTSPVTWSPAAMYEAVNIFASNLNPRMAQRFFNLVLLPAVRQNIADYKKLGFHYYRALRKALFKPAAFFKGILLPLVQESCTLREALILGSVVGKASIPPMHVAATIVRLAQMTPWYGTTSIVMTALINKKTALPLRVLEAVVAHFTSFARSDQALPLVWHRALLVFVQRYKFELDDEQKRRIKDLLKVHGHEAIGPEVRRELLAQRPGDAGLPPSEGASAMDLS